MSICRSMFNIPGLTVVACGWQKYKKINLRGLIIAQSNFNGTSVY